jgi:hypothetical protein
VNQEPLHAVFLVGGAANGKSTALRTRYRLVSDLDDDDGALPQIQIDRKLDPDDFKMGIPMFTFALDDEDAFERFGERGLGGPSGPLTRSDYMRYKLSIRQAVEANLTVSLEHDLSGFVERWLLRENPDFPDETNWCFGGGLTHELSKAFAQRNLERIVSENPPKGSFAWDAIGNATTYQDWIGTALKRGYAAHVIYVQAPLAVAHMWADERKRKLPPEKIVETYQKAADAAQALQRFVEAEDNPERLDFQRIPRGEDLLQGALERGYTEHGPPPS